MTAPTLRPKQIEDLAFLIREPRAALLHDPGVGKTPPVCVSLWWLWDELKVKSVFVMPKSLLKKNRGELLRFTKFKPEDLTILETVPEQVAVLGLMKAAEIRWVSLPDQKMIDTLSGTKEWKSKVKEAKRLGWMDDDGVTDAGRGALEAGIEKGLYQADKKTVSTARVEDMIKRGVFVKNGNKVELTDVGRTILANDLFKASLHFDAKVLLMGFDYFSDNWEWLLRYNPEIGNAAVDEIHLGYGDHNSGRTQQFYRAMNRIKRFIPMTGTLVNGRLSSAYPTIHVIEPRYYAGYGDFLNQHAVKDYWGSIIGWQNHDKITAILARHARRRSFAEEYGPEAKVILREVVGMSPKQREAYDEFHEKALLELEDGFLDGTLPGVGVLRARQIMQCPEVFDLCVGETTGKDERLKIHLGNAYNDGEPFLIFAVFQREQERIAEMVSGMGMTVDIINANVSAQKRGLIDEAFQKKELQVVVASPATAGIGFNWSHVNRMAFSSADYQDGNFMQAYRRAIRGERTSPLLIYVLEYENSIDQRIFQIIDQKAVDANKVDPTRQIFGLSQKETLSHVA